MATKALAEKVVEIIDRASKLGDSPNTRAEFDLANELLSAIDTEVTQALRLYEFG